MKKILFAWIVLIIFVLFLRLPAYAQSCITNYQPCDPNNPNASTCCSSDFYCSGGYCVPKPTPIPTFPTPCTGPDGSNPCNSKGCTGSPNSACEQWQGQCISGYCYPGSCRYGQSKNDCPDSYTCQNEKCKLGFINCTAGQTQVPCSNKQNCERECGVTTVDCQNSICVASTSPNPQCDSQGGACVDPTACSGNRQLIGKLDCQGILECCKPIPPQPTIPVYDPGCTPGDTENVKTALGCLPTNPFPFVNVALPWATLLGAGVAFLLGLLGALMIVLSAGNPEKLQAGKEIITSAVGGLIIIIFAVLILRIVGVNILGLFIGGK